MSNQRGMGGHIDIDPIIYTSIIWEYLLINQLSSLRVINQDYNYKQQIKNVLYYKLYYNWSITAKIRPKLLVSRQLNCPILESIEYSFFLSSSSSVYYNFGSIFMAFLTFLLSNYPRFDNIYYSLHPTYFVTKYFFIFYSFVLKKLIIS